MQEKEVRILSLVTSSSCSTYFLGAHRILSDEDVAECLTDSQWESFERLGADGDDEARFSVQVGSRHW